MSISFVSILSNNDFDKTGGSGGLYYENLYHILNLPQNYTFIVTHSNGRRKWILLDEVLYELFDNDLRYMNDGGYKIETKIIGWEERVKLYQESMPFAEKIHEVKRKCNLDLKHHGGEMRETLYSTLSHAQDKEDIWLYENAFYGKRRGVIVESGALNGWTFSTSYMFEQFADWKSIHIEADMKNFKYLSKIRPKSTNLNVALCSHDQDVHYVTGRKAVSGIYEFASPAFRTIFYPDILANQTILQDMPIIKCRAPKDLFDILGLKKGFIDIDIWVLDLEGAELEVINISLLIY